HARRAPAGTRTAGSFFRNMEKEHGTEFPVIRGAWPDWWTDGFGASARETSVTRKAAVSFIAGTGALSMASLAGMKMPEGTSERIDLINSALLFYTEHTTGYSESVREPYSQPTMEQRALKESYAWEANRRTAALGEDAMGLLQGLFRREKDPSLIVFNTLNWKRSGMVTVYIDHQIVPMGSTAGVFDETGNRFPSQPLSSRSDGTYWAIWIDDIPAFGYRKFFIRPMIDQNLTVIKDPQSVLENKWYKIAADLSKGSITSLYDKELSLELRDQGSEYGIGDFILEQLGNRSQMESHKLIDYKRVSLDTVWFDSFNKGPVFNSIRFYGETETAIKPRGFSIEIRLYNNEKKIEIVCSIIKKSIVTPESFYIAFPFGLRDGKHFTEVQGGVIETGKDQIKGSSNDWYTVQNFTAVRNRTSQIVFSCNEMPLMQFGAINTGRYSAGAMPESTHIFSWPMNNYWVTNFNAEQRGGHTWSYFITSSDDASNPFATRFGWGSRVPFLTRILPGEGTGDNNFEGSFITGWPENVLLISSRPANGGILLHLRETAGKKAIIDLKDGLNGRKLNTSVSDIAGNVTGDSSATIGPFESKFFLIVEN
ncbi:MAG: glycoside hydrolase family 38 C-terminal domain-containing protein, partial [Bacteroidota bacterium]|nr:glycoside hydrolase family 38 C-terminal domain-containing protein [Bacteroidota bacterium]